MGDGRSVAWEGTELEFTAGEWPSDETVNLVAD